MSFLPRPRQVSVVQEETPQVSSTDIVYIHAKKIPPLGQRSGFIPRVAEDFGDGGSFPEIHVAQYPLNMGRKEGTSNSVAITLDSEGKAKYDAILNPGGKRQIFSQHSDLVERVVDEEEMRRPDPEEEQKTLERTKRALEGIVNGRITAAQPTAIRPNEVAKGQPSYIRYTPSQTAENMQTTATSRIIRMTEMASDPLEPPKFKHKKVPKGPPSPPVPVMHSPPRKVTVKDQQDWKIPPCISNWKNAKGYTIPLDKRLAADGRGLQEFQINDNFAKLSESLYIAERTAREEVTKRAELERRLQLKEKEMKEEQLRKFAEEARMDRVTSQLDDSYDPQQDQARQERDQMREDRRRERERQLRIQRNKSTVARNMDRDIGEKIALGQVVPQQSTEAMFDQRLFGQSEGISGGFGDDESYNIYSKPLFHGSAANAAYRPKTNDEETYGGEEDYQKLLDTSKFKPDKGFSGAEPAPDQAKAKGGREKPVEFEKEELDPFGTESFLTQAKKSNALDRIGSRGHLSVSAAGNSSSKRDRIQFQESSNDKRRKL
eukprot:TRINITY_DN1368_c0_g1_i1.p1 TRINITY_DN1368_c0_g1~~TRINITY_DN1368_c0_g1_i1.p1  ORF type:complete len:547 (+),score=174.50 TRINITY_DN1368_c0_g1_i1:86-1726(+)